jgi:hypothetical protein
MGACADGVPLRQCFDGAVIRHGTAAALDEGRYRLVPGALKNVFRNV